MEKAWWELVDYGLSDKEQRKVDNLAEELARRVHFLQQVQTVLFLAVYL